MSENPPSPDTSLGQSLPTGTHLEEFVIERVLGCGGFGITYLARDKRLGRQVVIKENLPAQFCWRDTHSLTVRPRHTEGEDAGNFQYSLESFEREAATLASLDHPGIVKVLRSFEAYGTAYFVMPFVEGTALDEVIRQRTSQNNPFTEGEIQDLLTKVLDALSHLHDRGIYHRDIKPGNILITQSGPVLIDFGAARQRLSERSLTVIESAGYTPFEQLQSRGKIGPWSDIYALGATLYKVITGQTVARANDRVMDDPHVLLMNTLKGESQYSKSLLASIDKALAPYIGARFQTVADWRAAIADTTDALPERPAEESPPAPPAEQAGVVRKSQKRRKQWVENITALVVALVTAGVVVALVRSPSTSDEAPALLEESSQSGVGNTAPLIPTIPSPQTPDSMSGNPQQQPPKAMQAAKDSPFINTLGMKFVPVPGTEVLMCVHETRNVDYAAYAAANSGVDVEWRPVAVSGKDQHPVVNVSNEDAEGFCRWLSTKEGRTYRLPTDAEWSVAVGLQVETGRTPKEKYDNGPKEVFPWGTYYPPKLGDGNYGLNELDDGYNKTAPVMSFRANELGIYDLGGNIWEWCQDWYDDTQQVRVLRGASWVSNARVDLSSSYRYVGHPLLRHVNGGFRCVLVVAGG